MKIIDEEEKRKILDEIIKEQNFRTEIKPEEFTLTELMKEHSLTRHQADTLIKNLLIQKKITSRDAVRKSKPCTAYSFIE